MTHTLTLSPPEAKVALGGADRLIEMAEMRAEQAGPRRRPARGIVSRSAEVGTFAIGEALSEAVYECPLFPDGIRSGAVADQSTEVQIEIARHWFRINFAPLPPDPTSGVLGMGVPGQMILGRPAFAGDPNRRPTSATAELGREFGQIMLASAISELAALLESMAVLWQFIPLPDPLPIEFDDGAARLQSEVDAAHVRRDVDELDAHLAVQATAPQVHGQNYWPGAELLDDGLRNETKEVAERLREAATVPVTPIEPIKQSVNRLVGIRNKVGQWIAEGAVKGLASDAAKWGVSSAPLWWHWFYHLLTQLLTDAQAWLLSLLGA